MMMRMYVSLMELTFALIIATLHIISLKRNLDNYAISIHEHVS